MDSVFKNSKSVAVFGGTFNPVHIGHMAILNGARKQFPQIENFVLMPTATTYYKDGTAIVSANHRLEMLRIAAEDAADVFISDMEIKRGGITYTVDTVNAIHEINPEIDLYFIIGADSLFYFDRWVRYKEILEKVTLLCARRACDREKMQEKAEEIIAGAGLGTIYFLDTPEFPFSSTEIRNRVKAGEDAADMLPAGVYEYIKENGLYR